MRAIVMNNYFNIKLFIHTEKKKNVSYFSIQKKKTTLSYYFRGYMLIIFIIIICKTRPYVKTSIRESVQLGKFESIAFFAVRRLTRGTVVIIYFRFLRVRITVEKQAQTDRQ